MADTCASLTRTSRRNYCLLTCVDKPCGRARGSTGTHRIAPTLPYTTTIVLRVPAYQHGVVTPLGILPTGSATEELSAASRRLGFCYFRT